MRRIEQRAQYLVLGQRQPAHFEGALDQARHLGGDLL